MKWKKLTALFLAMAMMITMLTACGGGGGGGSFDDKVSDWLSEMGYDITVVPSKHLDNIIKAYTDSENVIPDDVDSESCFWMPTLAVGLMMGWNETTSGNVIAISDQALKNGINLNDLIGGEVTLPDEIKKIGTIDTPEKLAAVMAAIGYMNGYGNLNISVAQAETESDEPAWVIALQGTMEDTAEGEE